jgi:hypothetical protein
MAEVFCEKCRKIVTLPPDMLNKRRTLCFDCDYEYTLDEDECYRQIYIVCLAARLKKQKQTSIQFKSRNDAYIAAAKRFCLEFDDTFEITPQHVVIVTFG